jgi:sucrose-6-phosphate hydrolase SacC (GH32 family)
MTDFRDPHAFWSDAARRWVMVVALPNDHKVLIYQSPDLKRWEKASEFGPAGATGGQWECPTLAQVPVEGGQSRWLLKVGLNPGALQGGSGEQYFVGSFDGTRFTNENPADTTLWTDYGKDCYCALPFNGTPPGGPVLLGWMSNWQYAGNLPTAPWRGQMTIPRRLQLRKTPQGLRLAQQPVELKPLRKGRATAASASWELRASVDPGKAREFVWKVFAGEGKYTLVGYNTERGEFFVDRADSGETAFHRDFPARTAVKWPAGKGPIDFLILGDRSTLEVFAAGGLVAISNLVYPPPGAHAIEFQSEGARLLRQEVWELASTWMR